MFPRAAVVIAVLLVTTIAAIWIRAGRVSRELHCHRDVAIPYQRLLDRMQQLADGGQTEELRLLIAGARERSSDIAVACAQPSEDSPYARQVWELTK
jgi:hypothetical protein